MTFDEFKRRLHEDENSTFMNRDVDNFSRFARDKVGEVRWREMMMAATKARYLSGAILETTSDEQLENWFVEWKMLEGL